MLLKINSASSTPVPLNIATPEQFEVIAESVLFKKIVLSSTFNTSAFNCTVLPETVKSPVTVKSPEIVPPAAESAAAATVDTVSILEFAAAIRV